MAASATSILGTRALGNINNSSDSLNGNSRMTEIKVKMLLSKMSFFRKNHDRINYQMFHKDFIDTYIFCF